MGGVGEHQAKGIIRDCTCGIFGSKTLRKEGKP